MPATSKRKAFQSVDRNSLRVNVPTHRDESLAPETTFLSSSKTPKMSNCGTDNYSKHESSIKKKKKKKKVYKSSTTAPSAKPPRTPGHRRRGPTTPRTSAALLEESRKRYNRSNRNTPFSSPLFSTLGSPLRRSAVPPSPSRKPTSSILRKTDRSYGTSLQEASTPRPDEKANSRHPPRRKDTSHRSVLEAASVLTSNPVPPKIASPELAAPKTPSHQQRQQQSPDDQSSNSDMELAASSSSDVSFASPSIPSEGTVSQSSLIDAVQVASQIQRSRYTPSPQEKEEQASKSNSDVAASVAAVTKRKKAPQAKLDLQQQLVPSVSHAVDQGQRRKKDKTTHCRRTKGDDGQSTTPPQQKEEVSKINTEVAAAVTKRKKAPHEKLALQQLVPSDSHAVDKGQRCKKAKTIHHRRTKQDDDDSEQFASLLLGYGQSSPLPLGLTVDTSRRGDDVSQDGSELTVTTRALTSSSHQRPPVSHVDGRYRPIEESEVSSAEEWSVADDAGSSRTTISVKNKLYSHPPLPPGWTLQISSTKNLPFYSHPDHGTTWYCPVPLPTKSEAASRKRSKRRKKKEVDRNYQQHSSVAVGGMTSSANLPSEASVSEVGGDELSIGALVDQHLAEQNETTSATSAKSHFGSNSMGGKLEEATETEADSPQHTVMGHHYEASESSFSDKSTASVFSNNTGYPTLKSQDSASRVNANGAKEYSRFSLTPIKETTEVARSPSSETSIPQYVGDCHEDGLSQEEPLLSTPVKNVRGSDSTGKRELVASVRCSHRERSSTKVSLIDSSVESKVQRFGASRTKETLVMADIEARILKGPQFPAVDFGDHDVHSDDAGSEEWSPLRQKTKFDVLNACGSYSAAESTHEASIASTNVASVASTNVTSAVESPDFSCPSGKVDSPSETVATTVSFTKSTINEKALLMSPTNGVKSDGQFKTTMPQQPPKHVMESDVSEQESLMPTPPPVPLLRRTSSISLHSSSRGLAGSALIRDGGQVASVSPSGSLLSTTVSKYKNGKPRQLTFDPHADDMTENSPFPVDFEHDSDGDLPSSPLETKTRRRRSSRDRRRSRYGTRILNPPHPICILQDLERISQEQSAKRLSKSSRSRRGRQSQSQPWGLGWFSSASCQ